MQKKFNKSVVLILVFLILVFIKLLIPYLFSEVEFNTNENIKLQEVLHGLLQNDSRILKYIRQNHLIPPSVLPYNLSEPNIDSGSYHGQPEIIRQIFKNKTGGFFIEAGANDGEYLSTTLFLEKDLKWTGLLAEPDPREIPSLLNKHRKAWISDVCISPHEMPSSINFYHRVNYSIASKLSNAEMDDEIKYYPESWENFKVLCFPIFSILAAMEITVVDYFSLDVEGVELEVLKHIPFDSVFIKVFSVEYNLIPEGKEALVQFMASKGYNFVAEAYHDYIFAHDSLNYTNVTLVYEKKIQKKKGKKIKKPKKPKSKNITKTATINPL